MEQEKINIFIGIDPGVNGAVAALIGNQAIIFPTPTIIIKKNNKNKKQLDSKKMFDILNQFKGQNVKLALEQVSARPGEGTVSSFSFGFGYGLWYMASVACGFDMINVRPQIWRNYYEKEYSGKEMLLLKENMSALKAKSKVLKGKNDINKIKDEIKALNYKIKKLNKNNSREIAGNLYPDVKEHFSKVSDDGKAEAVLIARYCSLQEHVLWIKKLLKQKII